MKNSVRRQARWLAALLFLLGLGSILYQTQVLKVPWVEGQASPVWTVDVRVGFDARPNVPVKVRMFVPALQDGYADLDESFISSNYGAQLSREGENRLVTWSSRRARGRQALYYRLVLAPQATGDALQPGEGPQFRERPELSERDRVAVDALLEPIRGQSADIETFIGEAVKQVANTDNDNVRLLLSGDNSPQGRARVVSLLLAAAHIPTDLVHTLELRDGLDDEASTQKLELWLRSFNGKRWLYFNPADGRQGLPKNHMIWWVGEEPLLALEGGRNATASFSVRQDKAEVLQLAQTWHAQERQSFVNLSLYEMPIPTQQLLMVVLMIPVGVLVVVLMRALVGLETLGTFTPVLIALAFRETRLALGLLLFILIAGAGLMVRSYLEYLKLQRLSRLAVMLIFVIMMMILLSILSYKLGLAVGLSVGLFPMVILTMVIERLSIAWEERGGVESMQLGLVTLMTAVLCYGLMIWRPLRYVVFTFPGSMLILAAIIVLVGHYRGYRLNELVRFRALAEDRG